MAASPGDAEEKSALHLTHTSPATPPNMGVCRLCAKESPDLLDIFGEQGKAKELPKKLKLCAPILVSENDDLSTAVCSSCVSDVDMVETFFQKCFNANQELIIALRKSRPNPLDLNTHINQYTRSFNAPIVPQIKIEPFLEDLEKINGDASYYDEDWIVNEEEEEEEQEDSEEITEEESEDNDDDELFKVPKVPSRRGKRSKLTYGGEKKKGRKRFVPLALKTCSECGQEFSDHAGNLQHWKEVHPNQEVLYKCQENEMCNFTSKESEDIFKHRSKHKTVNQHNQVEVKTEANVDCKICGKYFTTSFLIHRHLSTHEDRKDHKCGVCGIENKSSDDLASHLKAHDTDDAKYSHCCELCGKRFTQRANLDAHLRVHSGYKPYSCDFCGKSFSQKGNMEEHRRVHTGERPFVCEQCGSSFVRRSEMALHTRIAHTGERPYQCAYCPKNFQRRDLMRKHERIHTDTRPYVCQFCHKAFTQRDKMVVHTRLHTGERPYVCDVCGKGFCESGNLKKHMRVHGKEPPLVMHQNNKGKPAPLQTGSSFETKPTPNQLVVHQQQFQQQVANEADNNSVASSAPRPDSIASPAPSAPPTPAPPTTTHHAPLPLHLKLQTEPQHQYPFAAVAAALQGQNYSNNYREADNQSEAGSERSLGAASPFVSNSQHLHPHPAHQQHPQPPQLPYHMHHSLIQHLTDMRDLYHQNNHP